MYNFEKIKMAEFEDMVYLFEKADLMKGKKGRSMRKALSWLLEEEF